MLVIAICAALVAAGVVIVVRWGDGPLGDPTRPTLAGLARYGAIMVAAGSISGLLAAGAGGRLAMRLLALTSPDSDGMVTEGGAVIGDITLGGTVGFMIFIGLFAGLVSGVLYALLQPLLTRGRVGGVVLGAVVLVLAGSRLEPLRADNFDFALLGPDWLSVLVFASLGVFQGMLVVAVAGRLSGRAPLPRLAAGTRALVAARFAAGIVVLAALPAFVNAVAEILRG